MRDHKDKMNMSSPQMIADEPRSLTPEPSHQGTRTPRRSHVSIASSKRLSINAGGTSSTKVKQGMFRRAVPHMPRPLAFICFALNLILPGTGKNNNMISLFSNESIIDKERSRECFFDIFHQKICF